MRVIKIKIEVSEENYKILNSILENGFVSYCNEWQPRDINQVIARLIELVYYEDYLKDETSDIYWKLNLKEWEGVTNDEY